MKSPKAFGSLWRRVGSGPRSVALLLALGGVALVLASMLPGPPPDDAWLRDLLMTVGGSLALFAPLYLVTRSLDRHLDRVAEETERRVEEVRTDTAQQVQQVRDEAGAAKSEMEALRQDVAQRLEDIDAQVRSRLEQEEASDVAAIEALRDAPSRDAVMAALRRAHEMALVSVDRPPRVKISKGLKVYLS